MFKIAISGSDLHVFKLYEHQIHITDIKELLNYIIANDFDSYMAWIDVKNKIYASEPESITELLKKDYINEITDLRENLSKTEQEKSKKFFKDIFEQKTNRITYFNINAVDLSEWDRLKDSEEKMDVFIEKSAKNLLKRYESIEEWVKRFKTEEWYIRELLRIKEFKNLKEILEDFVEDPPLKNIYKKAGIDGVIRTYVEEESETDIDVARVHKVINNMIDKQSQNLKKKLNISKVDLSNLKKINSNNVCNNWDAYWDYLALFKGIYNLIYQRLQRFNLRLIIKLAMANIIEEVYLIDFEFTIRERKEGLKRLKKFYSKETLFINTMASETIPEAEFHAEIEKMENPIVYTIYAGYQESEIVLNEIINLLKKNLEGYSILHTEGYWMGEEEKAIKIDIIGSVNDKAKIQDICIKILEIADQDAVVLLYDFVQNSELISRKAMIIKPKELILKGRRFFSKTYKLK